MLTSEPQHKWWLFANPKNKRLGTMALLLVALVALGTANKVDR